MSARMETARAGWGDPVPDWIEALARACDATSQNHVATRLGYSGAVVSQLLRSRYPGDTARLEQLVRAELMREVVTCPVLGEIALSECLGHRGRASNFRAVSPLAIRMRRACNRCPRHIGGDDAD